MSWSSHICPPRRQVAVFGVLLLINAAAAFAVYAFGLQKQFMEGQELPAELARIPGWVLGLANAGIVVVLYGVLGLAGWWFAHRLNLPGIYRPHAGWRQWLVIPMAMGVVVGIALVIGDRMFVALSEEWTGFPHPAFPLSVVASVAAGIGEEIVFRLFVLGLWAFLLNLILKRYGATSAALWCGNVIAAVAFGAAHLPGAIIVLGVSSLAEVPGLVLCEIFVLNGVVGVVAGERYMRQGLVAAVGVHFWADVVWHILWPALHGGPAS